MNTQIARLALTDPAILKESDFLQTFIARADTVEQLLNRIRRAATEPLCPHTLVYGQRGMGNTSLLRRLAIAVRDDTELSAQWIPLTFREEQYNVASLTQLWVNCADALADWCQKQGDTASADALDDAIDDAQELWPLMCAVTEQHQRRPLLLVDNLDLILNNLSNHEAWALREILQQSNSPMLLACSSRLPASVTERDVAFYHFFKLTELKPLSAADMHSCLVKFAALRGEAGKRVKQQLDNHPAQLPALHTLCGGNPRTLTVIYQILETLGERDGNTVADLLEGVLESCTPLYKARTEEIAEQQRRVFDAIALHWDPVDSKTISKKTELATNKVSPQLNRLETDGLIERVSLGGKRKGYQVQERFFNIWYLMRHGSRRSRERLRCLTQFLNAWFSPGELKERARDLVHENSGRSALSEALLHALDDSPERTALNRRLSRDLSPALREILEPEVDYDAAVVGHIERQALLKESLVARQDLTVNVDEFCRLLARSLSLDANQKQYMVDSIATRTQTQIDAFIEVFLEESANWTESLGDGYQCLAKHYEQGDITGDGDEDGMLSVLSTTKDTSVFYALLAMLEPNALASVSSTAVPAFPSNYNGSSEIANHLGDTLKISLSCFDVAECAYRRAIQIDANHSHPWNNLGHLLHTRLNRFEEAEQAYRRAIELDESSAQSWFHLGNLLQYRLERFDEAEQAYRRAIEIDDNRAFSWGNLGNLLQYRLERFDEAEEAYRRALEIDGKSANTWSQLGDLLRNHLMRFEEAEEAYRKALEIDACHNASWNSLGNLLLDYRADSANAESAFSEAIALDAADWSAPMNLGWSAILQGDTDRAQRLAGEFETDTPGYTLLKASIALHQANLGDAFACLTETFTNPPEWLWQNCRDDMLRLTRVVKETGFSQQYIDWLKQNKFDVTLAPYVAAATAWLIDADHLKRVNPEVRSVAEPMYRWLLLTEEARAKSCNVIPNQAK